MVVLVKELKSLQKSSKALKRAPTKGISTTTTTIREEFKTHASPFAVNIQQLSMHSLKSGAA